MRVRVLITWSLTVALVACKDSAPSELISTSQDTGRSGVNWSEGDNPNHLDFGQNFEYVFDSLPTIGQVTTPPWAGSYWPTHLDSVNHRWDAEHPDNLSPSEKYELAFGKSGITDAVSAEYGIDSMTHRTRCIDNSVCNSSTGEVCAKRRGRDAGYCVETWFGICHAWGPASLMEPEPVNPVIYNGVEFKVNDIKALITLSYDVGLKSKSLSETCEDRNTGDSTGIQYDEYGRPTEAFSACADTNAGTFHTVVANMIGIQKIGLVEDRTYDYEVWNQPLRAFKVWKKFPKVIDAAKANALLGAEGAKYIFNQDAVGFRHVKLSLDWVAEAEQSEDGNLSANIDNYTHTDVYEYIVELDADGKVIGGEWIRDSRTNHPDFLWAAVEKENTEVAIPKVSMLDESVTVAAGEFEQVGTSYSVEPGQKVKITMTGDRDADLYVRFKYRPTKSRFDCRPFRADSNEECEMVVPAGQTKLYIKVDGGAAGATVQVQGVKQIPGSGIEWEDIKRLLELSVAPPAEEGGFNWGSRCDGGSGSFEQAIEQDALVEVGAIPAEKHQVRIELSSQSDVDIQLIDQETTFKIIAYPDGLLGGEDGNAQACATWNEVEYCYSGWDGDQTASGKGNEWITITGDTNRPLTMKAFGYAAGNALVRYSWAKKPDCIDQGNGSFTQSIEKNATVDVGVIPAGKKNLKIELTSEKDVDIQLYDDAVPIVMWDNDETALLFGEGLGTTTYKGMTITYSGYNGDGTNFGHEFITVKGEVATPLTMKAFGYAAGEAQVNYAWGLSDEEVQAVGGQQ